MGEAARRTGPVPPLLGGSSADTIFAPASGQGRAAICVIRLSGSRSADVLRRLIGRPLPQARRVSLRRLRDPECGEFLDQAVVIWMPGSGTFTGEDQAELQVHGGRAVQAAILRALSREPGCRAAEPGEFTRRAFLNGRLDLPAAEGLADLIDADTDAQRRQAMRQLEGALGQAVAGWRERLVDRLAWLEASLDFSDEDDVSGDIGADDALADVSRGIEAALAGFERGERIRDGFTVVIAGPPNAGKSTLLNALARREAAIVSAVPGTTRDAIEVRCDLRGLPVTLVDTAGLRDTVDEVEREGVTRARRRMEDADLVLWLSPADDPGAEPPDGSLPCLAVRTKADLVFEESERDGLVSARTGEGLPQLLDAIAARAESPGVGEAVVTRERHRAALCEVLNSLAHARAALRGGTSELAAEDLRLALRSLGRITGQVDAEEVLDRIFAAFCIGK